MMWLAETPRALVRACLRMLPRLHAEEALRVSERVAVGSGTLPREARAPLIHGWIRAARGQQSPERATPADLGRAGIGVHRVIKRRPEASVS